MSHISKMEEKRLTDTGATATFRYDENNETLKIRIENTVMYLDKIDKNSLKRFLGENDL